MTGEVQTQFANWVETAVIGEQAGKLIDIWQDEERVGMGYEFERFQSAVVDATQHTWTERVQIIRSESAAESQTAALSGGWTKPKQPCAA